METVQANINPYEVGPFRELIVVVGGLLALFLFLVFGLLEFLVVLRGNLLHVSFEHCEHLRVLLLMLRTVFIVGFLEAT